jgi:hypothetical protein
MMCRKAYNVGTFTRIDRSFTAVLILSLCTLGGGLPGARPQGPSAGADTSFSIDIDTVLRAVTYGISTRGCRVRMELYSEHSINRGGISHNTSCPMPLTVHHALYEKLIRGMFGDLPRRDLIDSVRWISWGRIGDGETEMSQRLAIAAKGSPHWDPVKGKTTAGEVNLFVRDLANERMIYPEIKDLFAAYGWDIKVTSVEKVLIARAGKLPSFGILKSHGIRRTDALPFDFQMWFSVSRTVRE